jgi:acyl dehydratase
MPVKAGIQTAMKAGVYRVPAVAGISSSAGRGRAASGVEMTVTVGERFSRRHVFTPEDIADFARRAGDMNPLHHDAEKAARSRFGGLIASGPQTSAMLMALAAAHLSREHDTVGLEFTFRFCRAVPAGLAATLSWEIASIEPHPKLGGDLVVFTGEITGDDGTRYLTAEGRAVLWPLPDG